MQRLARWLKPLARLLSRGWSDGRETRPEATAIASDVASGEEAGASQGEHDDVPVTVMDGEVAIRDGEFDITDPTGGGLPPVLIPGDDVILLVEGQVVTKPVSVWAGRSIQVRPQRESQPVRGYRVQVSPNRMAAYLVLDEKGAPGYRVRDAGPAHVITLSAEALPGLQANPTIQEIESALEEAGVVAGIDRSAIDQALRSEGPVTMQIAAGKAPQPGTSGRIESAGDGCGADDSINIAARVEPGQRLVRLIPPQEGEPGYDVLGNRLDPEPVRRCTLEPGYGAVLSGDGTVAYATLAGRPVVIESEPWLYRAAVVPVVELSGPLTAGPVPYRFEGDVVVNGDIDGTFTVQAGGWIWVRGSVHGATLEAGHGILVEGTARWSRLITRATRTRLAEFHQQYGRIAANLAQMRDYARLIVKHERYAELARSRSFGGVMLLLAQAQFDDLGRQIRQARQTLSDLNVLRTMVDLEGILNALEYRLYSGNLRSVDDLTQFIDTITLATQRAVDILSAGGSHAPVHAATLLGAVVDADGDVLLDGSGAEQTVMRVRGRVQATHLRDVRVFSNAAIETDLAVATTPDSTLLQVPARGYIAVGMTFGEVAVQVGEWRHVLAPASRDIQVHSHRRDPDRVVVDRLRRPVRAAVVNLQDRHPDRRPGRLPHSRLQSDRTWRQQNSV